ncbi:MAG: SEC-C metal-binding domain-containing protein, partial [SAR202 cluster bacterium]|nr:SEC-C metal-binding domain-containing protein [SAR202 cluster bacterium]
VADVLIDGLVDVAVSNKGVEVLHQFLTNGAADSQKASIVNILLRNGTVPAKELLGDLSVERLLRDLPDTDAAAEFIFSRYLERPDEEEFDVQALAQVCNVDDIYAMIEDPDESYAQQIAQDYEKSWGINIPSISNARSLAEAQQLLREALTATTESYALQDTQFPLLTTELRKARERISAALEITETGQHSEAQLLIACALGVFRDTACLRGLANKPDATKLWKYLTMRKWKGEDIDADVIATLEGEEPKDTLSVLRNALDAGSTYAAYAYRVLEALRTPDRHLFFQDAQAGDFGDPIADDLDGLESLMFADPESAAAILKEWSEKPPTPQKFALLRLHPTEDAALLLLKHFESYMSQPFSSFLIHTMEEIGSQSFLEPLLREWRAGEDQLGGAIRLLAELHGLEDDESVKRIPIVDRETPETMESLMKESDDPLSGMEGLHPPVPLQCTNCNRTYHYQLDKVQVAQRIADFAANQIVQCKGCGSLETYRFTSESSIIMTAELMKSAMMGDMEETENPVDSYLAPPGRIAFTGGRSFRNLSEAYHYLIGQLERNPENPTLQLRMGNMLRNGLRPDLAVPYLKEAMRLNPKEIDAIHVLAGILIEEGRFWEALPHLENLVNLCRDPATDERQSREVFDSLVMLSSRIEDAIGHRIELFKTPNQSSQQATAPPQGPPGDLDQMFQLFRYGKMSDTRNRPRQRAESDRNPWAPERQESARATKVGRNQPCPCGSGKKYKRCCGG